MKEKKDIERLFQEKFKNFDVNPTPQVWENIASKLEEKESKKRIIPFWFNLKAAGIAASLVIGFFVVNNNANLFKFNQEKGNLNSLVSTEKKDEKLVKNPDLIKNGKALEENNLVERHSTTNGSKIELNKKDIKKSSQKTQNWTTNSNNTIAESSNTENSANENTTILKRKNSFINHQRINSNNNKLKYDISNKNKALVISEKTISSRKDKNSLTQESFNSNSASSEITLQKNTLKESLYVEKNHKESQAYYRNANSQIADNSGHTNSKKRTLKKSISNIPTSDKTQQVITKNIAMTDKIISNNLDSNSEVSKTNTVANAAIVNQSVVTTKQQSETVAKDSVIVAVVQENVLEKILKEKEANEKEEKKIATNSKKWKIKPSVAPLFTNSTKGSPIDNQFANNEKSYENTMSLGLGVDYAVSKRISIRTGIHKFDYSYNTKNIVYYADLASKNASSVSNLKTINVVPEAKNMIIENRQSSITPEIAIQTKEDGLLNQKTGYLEIPVEISYKLLDKKFGIQFITGFSSLFLNENRISVISSDLATVVGEANNLNKIHFSTNIGLGFKYSFWKSFEANFEPTFKYQINTYNADSGGFKPYLIGLYSGISFKF